MLDAIQDPYDRRQAERLLPLMQDLVDEVGVGHGGFELIGRAEVLDRDVAVVANFSFGFEVKLALDPSFPRDLRLFVHGMPAAELSDPFAGDEGLLQLSDHLHSGGRDRDHAAALHLWQRLPDSFREELDERIGRTRCHLELRDGHLILAWGEPSLKRGGIDLARHAVHLAVVLATALETAWSAP